MSGSATSERGGSRLSGRIRRFEPPLRPIPRGPEYREFRADDGRRVFVHEEVLGDLAALELEEHPNETAGLLFGRIFTDGSSQCALVRYLIRPLCGEVIGTPVTVTITAEGSAQMSARAQLEHPCADPVGWAHTHPTFNAYFSGTDRDEQAVWTSPASVGLVISGLSSAQPPLAVYVGPAADQTRAVTALQPAEDRRVATSVSPPPVADPRPGGMGRSKPPGSPAPSPRRLWGILAAALLAFVLGLLVFASDPWTDGGSRDHIAKPLVESILEAEREGLSRSAADVAALAGGGLSVLERARALARWPFGPGRAG